MPLWSGIPCRCCSLVVYMVSLVILSSIFFLSFSLLVFLFSFLPLSLSFSLPHTLSLFILPSSFLPFLLLSLSPLAPSVSFWYRLSSFPLSPSRFISLLLTPFSPSLSFSFLHSPPSAPSLPRLKPPPLSHGREGETSLSLDSHPRTPNILNIMKINGGKLHREHEW